MYRGRILVAWAYVYLTLKTKNFDPLVKDKLDYCDQQEIFMNKLHTELEIAQNELKSL